MRLHHRPFCPHSRFVRLVLSECGVEPELIEERPWARDEAFLRLNPEGLTPVLVDGDVVAPSAGLIVEWLADIAVLPVGDRSLMPAAPALRVEARRLMRWFGVKMFEEASGPLVLERIEKRFIPADQGGGAPDGAAIRAAKTNLRYHLRYIGWLAARNDWLAGESMTVADLAAAAHLSVVDYLGDVAWAEDETAKEWYARVKSRPSFRPLLAERAPGAPPSPHYADLDF